MLSMVIATLYALKYNYIKLDRIFTNTMNLDRLFSRLVVIENVPSNFRFLCFRMEIVICKEKTLNL